MAFRPPSNFHRTLSSTHVRDVVLAEVVTRSCGTLPPPSRLPSPLLSSLLVLFLRPLPMSSVAGCCSDGAWCSTGDARVLPTSRLELARQIVMV